jgi:hypothetical protein
VMTRDQGYDPHHVSVKPLAKQPAPPKVSPHISRTCHCMA